MILQLIRWAEVLGRIRPLPPVAPWRVSGGMIDLTAGQVAPRTRSHSEVERVVLHQTAVEFGVSRRQLEAAGGDRTAARRQRFRRVPYHYLLTLDGELLKLHPLDAWTYHARGAPNRTSIGVCCEGLFPRFERDRKPKPKHTMPRPEWAAQLALVELDVARILGRKVPLVTHAQCSRVKRADPGEAVMRAANKGWSLHARDWTRAGGVPQPAEWRQG